nr:MAG TPA: hypothetical protein [Caudoviricetes sp.]
MIGLLTKKLIDFFRQTDIVIENHIPVLTSNVSDGRTVVNTTLPAIVVTVDSAPNNMVYIGGLIRDNINIDIVVMDRLVNYTLSGETDIYEWRRNLAYKLRTELFTERASEFFKDILQGNNFLPMYRGMNNFIKQGYKEDTEEDIECWRMKFECVMVDNSTIDITYIKAKSGSVQLIDKQINPVTPIHPHYGIEEMMWKYGYGQYIPDLLDMIVTSGQITDQYKDNGTTPIPKELTKDVLFLPENFPMKTIYYNTYGILLMNHIPQNERMVLFKNNISLRYINIDTSSFNLGSLFINCFNLRRINKDNVVDCSNSTTFLNIFRNCSMLEDVSFINIDEDKSQSWDLAFRIDNSIEYFNLKNISFSPKLIGTSFRYMFYNQQYLENINGEIDFTKSATTGTDLMFYSCNNLKEVRFTKESLKYDLQMAQSKSLSLESLQSIIDGLGNVTTTRTLSLNSIAYNKLTEEQKQSATDKGWTITG